MPVLSVAAALAVGGADTTPILVIWAVEAPPQQVVLVVSVTSVALTIPMVARELQQPVVHFPLAAAVVAPAGMQQAVQGEQLRAEYITPLPALFLL
ncbi:hypothetical protein D9M68_971830 [compost metagenome]